MAHMQLSVYSNQLKREVKCQVIIPIDQVGQEGQCLWNGAPLKCLYLLHGVVGNENDWMLGTRILSWAQERNLAVVMPTGDNRFYIDQKSPDAQYGKFIGQELVEVTRKMFPISHRREDTFIGGLSMGGYGAIVNGLKYSETFGFIIGLSSALMLDEAENSIYETADFLSNRDFYETVFGDLDHVRGSDKDYCALVLKNKDQDKVFPHIYLACGTEDFLIEKNRWYVRFLQEHHVEVMYEEGPGEHNWEFWDTYIKRALNWLPLNNNIKGISSGNVK